MPSSITDCPDPSLRGDLPAHHLDVVKRKYRHVGAIHTTS